MSYLEFFGLIHIDRKNQNILNFIVPIVQLEH